MHRELLEHFKTELDLLWEYAAEYAEEYPGIADRLGGLTREGSDPAIVGLLQGAALLAARVQLKLKHEFPEFARSLIDQIYPTFLAPVPSAALVAARPAPDDPGLKAGRTLKRGSAIDSVFQDSAQRVNCRFTLTSDLTYDARVLAGAEYLPTPSAIQALQLEAAEGVAAGLRLTLALATAPSGGDKPSFSAVRAETLKAFIVGPEADAVAVYEQLFSGLVGAHLRFPDSFGNPQFVRLDPASVRQVGFGDGEDLLPRDRRVFRGFDFLRDYFLFARKFLGFEIVGLRRAFASVDAPTCDLIFTFSRSVPRLAAAVSKSTFALNAAPAVNLFPKRTDKVKLDSSQHEFQVLPDRAKPLSYEVNRVVHVALVTAGAADRRPIPPLYQATLATAGEGVAYTVRRLPRKKTEAERRHGAVSEYLGVETYVMLTQPGEQALDARSVELSVDSLCTNRHIAAQLPIGRGGADFRPIEDSSLELVALAPATRPREALLHLKHDETGSLGEGPLAWRLINVLALNHLGLNDPEGAALRETLSLFADLADAAVVKRIQGVKSVASRAVTRRMSTRAGVGVARGVEVTVTLEDKAFEGSGTFLLGAVLDRFFAEYAAVNHFTQTIVATVERGVIARWPPRSGSRESL